MACGGDDGGKTMLIDGSTGGGGDSGGGATCSAVTPAATDVNDETAGRFIEYFVDLGTVNGDLVGMYIDLAHTTDSPSIPTTVDIGADPNQQDYTKCTTCFFAFSYNESTMMVTHRYLAQSGTVTFTQDPITARHLSATATGVKLEEVVVNSTQDNYVVKPNGECLTLDATWDEDNVPNDWTCDAADWYSATANAACDCNCGVYDLDCGNPGQTTNGCSGATPVCWMDPDAGTTCLPAVANDSCANATTIVTPTAVTPSTVMGTTEAATRDYNMGLEGASCAGYPQPGRDVTYKIQLIGGTSYTFTLTDLPADFDAGISLVGPGTASVCSATITACVAGKDESFEGEDETFTYTPTTTGDYYLIVDSYYARQYGTFTVNVKTP